MSTLFARRLMVRLAFAFSALLPLSASAFSGLYIFGDSLSDTGNNAILLGIDAGQVITGNDYVPTNPYASGRYSNGEIWTSGFAAAIGAPGLASLSGGNIYAYGSARTRTVAAEGQPPLRAQVSTFLGAVGGVADSGALYVVAGGGNNARDTLEAVAGGAPLLRTVLGNARSYAQDVKIMVGRLKAAGAQQIVVWNTPDIAVAPSVRFFGSEAVFLAGVVTKAMNKALADTLAGETGVTVFDTFALFDRVVANPADYGLDNVTDACGAIAGCDPSKYLFWDGVHPTSAGHKIILDGMRALVGAP